MEDSKKSRRSSRVSLFLTVSKLLLALLVLAGTSLAWFSIQKREIKTLSAVNMPSTLDIRGAGGAAITQIQLDDVKNNKAQFLFSVIGDTNSGYKIEVAHTTNMPFEYKLYTARQGSAQTGESECIAPNGSGYVYNNVALLLVPLNQVRETGIAINDISNFYKANTYEATDAVQKNAMPLFEITADPISVGPTDIKPYVIDEENQNVFLHYYVLEVTWDDTVNSRETDMVYLLAKTVS